MKNHNKYDDLIQGYIDGALDKEEERELKEHLKECKTCREKLKEKEKLIQLIKASKKEVLPPRNLASIIIKRTTRRRIYRINWKYITAGAAAIFIISIILFSYQMKKEIPIAEKREESKIIAEHPLQEKREVESKEEAGIKPKKVLQEQKKIEEEKVAHPQKPFEETCFVFPEEGSVVGDEFEVVIIMKEPEEEIELNIDGEKKRYPTRGSNILYLHSDSLPALESGLHYLSIISPESQEITFYKEG